MKKIGIISILMLTILFASCTQLTLVGWGNINADLTIRGGSGNYSIAHPAAGNYRILWTDETETTAANSIVDVTPISSADIYAVWTGAVDGNMAISIYDSASNPVDAAFSFSVYQW